MRAIVPLVLLSAAAIPLAAQDDEEQKTVQVDLAMSRDDAVAEVATLFAEQGLPVGTISDGLVTTDAFSPNPNGFIKAYVVYRAVVVPRGDGARVILTGTMAADTKALTEAVAGVGVEDRGGWAITSRCRSECRKAWERLKGMADTLAARVGS